MNLFRKPLLARALTLAIVAGAAMTAAAPAGALDFALAPLSLPQCGASCPSVIVATGAISHQDAENFLFFAQRAGQARKIARVIFLHSPGGNMAGALRLGAVLRQMKMTAVVGQATEGRMLTGDCHSACVYLLMGGAKRVVPDGSRVGIHQMASSAISQRDIVGQGTIDAKFSPGDTLNALRGYVSRMGVNPAIVGAAEAVPHESIKVLSRAEISKFRLAGGKL